jgi:hypothetical protein
MVIFYHHQTVRGESVQHARSEFVASSFAAPVVLPDSIAANLKRAGRLPSC